MLIDVTTYDLEITDPKDLRPKPNPLQDLEIKQVEQPSPEFNRFLYAAVGATGTGSTGCLGPIVNGKSGWTAPSFRRGWLTSPGVRPAISNWTASPRVAWKLHPSACYLST